MKKRLLSVLLSLILVMSLAAALSTTAYAVDTITYELKKGDTVAKVCKELGVDFTKNYEWITKTNHITNYSKLPVGMKIILPAPGTTPKYEAPTKTTTTTTTTTTGTTTTTTGTTTVTAANAVVPYLVPYTLKSGDTVYKVCNSFGVSFQKYQNLITALNNVKSYTKLKVGQTLLLPSNTAPAAGTYYKIVAHKVVRGDSTVALCKGYGIDYGKNEAVLKALNNKANMAKIYVGETLYFPSPVNAGTGTGTGTTGTGTTGGGSGTTAQTTPSFVYELQKGDTVAKVCKDKGIDFHKNYQWITSTNNITDYTKLPAGKKIILPNPGVIASGPPSTGTSTGTGGTGTGGTGTGNTGSTTVPVDTGAHGTYTVLVNGAVASSAKPGDTVTINPTPDAGYTLDAIKVVKTGSNPEVTVPVTGNSFTMPDYPVTITVTFKAGSTT